VYIYTRKNLREKTCQTSKFLVEVDFCFFYKFHDCVSGVLFCKCNTRKSASDECFGGSYIASLLTSSVVVKDFRLKVKDEDKDKESSFKDKDKDLGRH